MRWPVSCPDRWRRELAGGLEDTYRRHLGLDLAPEAARIVPGVILAAVVALLAVAARGIRYRPVGRAGTAGCVGIAALDGFMIIGVLAADPAARWAVAVAVSASAARLGLSVRLLRPVLANG